MVILGWVYIKSIELFTINKNRTFRRRALPTGRGECCLIGINCVSNFRRRFRLHSCQKRGPKLVISNSLYTWCCSRDTCSSPTHAHFSRRSLNNYLWNKLALSGLMGYIKTVLKGRLPTDKHKPTRNPVLNFYPIMPHLKRVKNKKCKNLIKSDAPETERASWP